MAVTAGTEELQRPIDGVANTVAALAFYLNTAAGVNDQLVGVLRDSSNNLNFLDQTVAQQPLLAEVMYAQKTIDRNITVPAGYSFLQHEFKINNGFTLNVANGAEVVIL